MIRATIHAILACVVTLVICAVAYPVTVYGLGQLLFPHQAAGSLVVRDGKVIGSELIGQPFDSDRYFHPRPSAAGASGYDASAASGSNLGTKNPALRLRIALDTARQLARHTGDPGLKAALDALDQQQAVLKAKADLKEKSRADEDAIAKLGEQIAATQAQVQERAVEASKAARAEVPADLITASGSGLDPDISPEAAHYQEASIAAARNLPVETVRALITSAVDRSGAIIGAPPRVNVLALNLALDAVKPSPGSSSPVGPVPTPTGPATGTRSAPMASDREVKELRSLIGALTERLDQLQKRAGAVAVAADAAAWNTLKDHVNTLIERASLLEGRVVQEEQAIQRLRSEVAAARPSVKSTSIRPTVGSGTARPGESR